MEPPLNRVNTVSGSGSSVNKAATGYNQPSIKMSRQPPSKHDTDISAKSPFKGALNKKDDFNKFFDEEEMQMPIDKNFVSDNLPKRRGMEMSKAQMIVLQQDDSASDNFTDNVYVIP